MLGAWGSLWLTAIVLIGSVTIAFALLERLRPRFLEDWEPSKLPPVRDSKQIPRYTSVFGAVANVIFLAWWLNGKWELTVFDRSGVRIVLTAAWQPIFWAIAILSLATIAIFAVSFFRPYWTTLRAGIRLALDVLGAGVFCWFLKAQILAEIIVPKVSAQRAAEITNAFNSQMSHSFPLAIVVFAVIIALVDVGRIIRLRSSRAPRLTQSVALMLF